MLREISILAFSSEPLIKTNALRKLSVYNLQTIAFRKREHLLKNQKYTKNVSLKLSTMELPKHAQIVIAGAGTVGNSVAYHLVQKGWNDVVVLEQNKIGSGSSHFGSGSIALFKPISHYKLTSYSLKLYQHLHEMGFDIGFRKCGSLNLAQSKDRMIALKRRVAYNVPLGLQCEVRLFKNFTKNNIPH